MLKIEGDAFARAQRVLTQMVILGESDPSYFVRELKWIQQNLDALSEELKKLSLPMSQLQLDRARFVLASSYASEPLVKVQVFKSNLESLQQRIEDELGQRYLICISDSSSDYILGKKQIVNTAVSNALPDISTDLGEAMLCLGFHRYTACVFHLMRAMEAAVVRVGDRLNVTTIDKNGSNVTWGVITANIKNAVDDMPKGDERDKWQSIVGLLYAVKEAWRNKTMHPKGTYTEEEALEVYDAVKTFLRSLAREVA